MRAVKGKNTAPEIIVRKLIFSIGYRYRLHGSHLPGNPDIYFSLKKKAIFIHGCFWHGHICKRGDRKPSNNQAYWINKISRNKARDDKNLQLLSSEGWSTLVIWECELKDTKSLLHKIISFLKK